MTCKHGRCDRDDDEQVNPAVEQESSLNQDRLASRKNIRAMASFIEINDIYKSIEEDSPGELEYIYV